jgi:N-acetylglucosamine-6-phosphate deacetylase
VTATAPLVLTGGDLVLPDRVLGGGTLVIEGDRIVEVRTLTTIAPDRIDVSGRYVVPGFIDVHVHGAEGHDVLDATNAVPTLAALLPKYGVTAFCPTTVACTPAALRAVLDQVRAERLSPRAGASRVLPAHLESNFINPTFCGAQPLRCLRVPTDGPVRGDVRPASAESFSAADVLAEIDRAQPDVAIVTLAPELPGGLDLVKRLTAAGHRASLGHSGATFEEGEAAIAAGATQATHLFNRMPPLGHREPGLAGAVLARDEVAAEIICDGRHVHPAVIAMALAAKDPSRVMAISDATAGAGLPSGSRATLGGRPITVRNDAAYLDDGTLAGSTATMDRVFRTLVTAVGLSPVDAAIVCATTPARELGLQGHGVIAPGAVADLTVLDRDFRVTQTYVGGKLVYSRSW